MSARSSPWKVRRGKCLLCMNGLRAGQDVHREPRPKETRVTPRPAGLYPQLERALPNARCGCERACPGRRGKPGLAVWQRRAGLSFLILGCGHTGTTLISGILHINGYGSSKVSRLFEDEVLNDLNERILVGADVGEREIEDFLATLEKKTQGRWCLKDLDCPRQSSSSIAT